MSNTIKYIVFIALNIAFTYESNFLTLWGNCTLINHSKSLSNEKLINIIEIEIGKLNQQYKPIAKRPFTIIVTNNNNLNVSSSHWKWSLGITYKNPDKIIIKDLALSKISLQRFVKVMHHELNHIMINRTKNVHTIPRWFKEGFAMKTANEISMYHKLKIASKINNQDLFDLNNYASFINMNRSEFQFAYAISAGSILVLENLYGPNIIETIIQYLSDGYNFNEAFFNSTMITIDDFYTLFYEEIKNNFFWIKLINLPKNLFVIMPFLLIIGFYIKSYKNRKIIKQWELEEKLEKELEKLNNTDIN